MKVIYEMLIRSSLIRQCRNNQACLYLENLLENVGLCIYVMWVLRNLVERHFSQVVPQAVS